MTEKLPRVIINKQFLRKRWLDFRNGHSIYLVFVLTFVNFILIAYNLAIEKVPFLSNIFGSLSAFTVVFIAIYVPAAMLIGYWHRRNQYSVENEAMLQENWISAWLLRHQIRLIQGKVTTEETEEVLRYLENIIKRGKREELLHPKEKIPEFQGASQQQPAKNVS
ncbi:hypothetical protein [Candidatus Nitrososphaera gargensis]|uniref:hypothetical protein n=1 Tax=Candidatus Nitrososphaera gargensis TaxID=497727 RepID=UPI0011E54891|nr:hypothetical protein [Candidatus Nitrososphaera gargensis]